MTTSPSPRLSGVTAGTPRNEFLEAKEMYSADANGISFFRSWYGVGIYGYAN
jgi:hypothetical protein